MRLFFTIFITGKMQYFSFTVSLLLLLAFVHLYYVVTTAFHCFKVNLK